MEIWKELFGTFVGQLSIGVIIATIIITLYIAFMFVKKVYAKPNQKAESKQHNDSEHRAI